MGQNSKTKINWEGCQKTELCLFLGTIPQLEGLKKKPVCLHWSAGLILEVNLAPSKPATIMEGQGSNIKLVWKEVVQGLNLPLT
jgi:hypothetical protein